MNGHPRDPRPPGARVATALRRLAGAMAGRAPASPDPEYRLWLALRSPTSDELSRRRAAAASRAWRPWLDVVVLCRSGDPADLARTRAALEAQSWPYRRVHVPSGRDGALAAIAAAEGELVLAIEAGDVLPPHALDALATHSTPETDLVYGDEDRLGPRGREAPWLKSRWSPEELLSHPYATGAAAFRRALAAAAPEALAGGEGGHAALHALLPAGSAVVHVPDVLLSRAGTAAPSRDPSLLPRWDPAGTARVTVVVPTRDNAPLLAACVASLERHANRAELDLLVVDNGSREEDARALLRRLAERPRTRVVPWDRPFNWSAVNNHAARLSASEHLLFLNNDVEATHPGWLDAMLALASRPGIGLVGAQLLYPDGTLQHYGVVLGMTGFAGHLLQGCPPDAPARCGPADVIRDCSAVTGACLLVRRDLFERLGGFDERFILCGSDVALGIRAMEAGLRNVVTPHARLLHRESRTRGPRVPPSDFTMSYEVYEPWLRAGDPYYNPNLSLRDTRARLRLAPEDMLSVARSHLP